MNWRKHLVEAASLIIAAILCATVSNGIASRERKLVVFPSASGARPAASSIAVPPPAVTPTTDSGSRESVAGSRPERPSTPDSSPPNRAPTPKPQRQTLQLPVKSVKAVSRQFNPHPDKAYIEIGGEDVASLHSRGVLFLDARRTSVYEQGHIPGARPFSVWESDIDEKVNKLYAERPDPKDQNQPIVIYCSGGDCEDSHMLAQKLWGIGFNNAYVYKDGFPDWQKRGEPVHTGANP